MPNNDGHECLLAVVEAFADPWTGALASNADRHVGQRNLTILSGHVDAAPLLGRLDNALEVGDLLTLDVGPVAPAWIGGAYERGVASAADTSRGRGPLHLGPSIERIAELRKGDPSWPVGNDREPLGLASALRTALGARGANGRRAPRGQGTRALEAAHPAALHLGAQGGGYSVVLTR